MSHNQPKQIDSTVDSGLIMLFELLAKFDFEDRVVSEFESAVPTPLADSNSDVMSEGAHL